MLKVLWLARSIPLPPNSGDKIYSGQLVEALARAGAVVTYLGLAEHDASWTVSSLSRGVCWVAVPGSTNGVIASLISRRPVVAARYDTGAYRQALQAQLRAAPPDAVILDQYALVFALDELAEAGYRGPMIHLAHDFESQVNADIADAYHGNPLRRLAFHLNAMKTARSERDLCRAVDAVVTLTAEDARAFRDIGARRTIVLPPGYSGHIETAAPAFERRPRRVVIVGSFKWTAKQLNLADFIQAADSRLAEAQIELRVIGEVPETFRAAWRGRLRSTSFGGFVPDLAAELRQARVGLIIEKTGGGFKLKALDYVFNRLPVGALEGSFRGIPDKVRNNFIVAADVAALADAVIAAVDDTAELAAKQARAFDAAQGYFSWERDAEALLDEIASLIAPVMSEDTVPAATTRPRESRNARL